MLILMFSLLLLSCLQLFRFYVDNFYRQTSRRFVLNSSFKRVINIITWLHFVVGVMVPAGHF